MASSGVTEVPPKTMDEVKAEISHGLSYFQLQHLISVIFTCKNLIPLIWTHVFYIYIYVYIYLNRYIYIYIYIYRYIFRYRYGSIYLFIYISLSLNSIQTIFSGGILKKELSNVTSVFLELPQKNPLRATLGAYKTRFEEYMDEHLG